MNQLKLGENLKQRDQVLMGNFKFPQNLKFLLIPHYLKRIWVVEAEGVAHW